MDGWFLLGMPLALIFVTVLVAWQSRRRLKRAEGVFRCRLRAAGPTEGRPWPRTKSYGYWVHDVLLVHHGWTLLRYEAFAVASIVGPVEARTAKRLGPRPMWIRLHLDDGRLMDLAARNHDVRPATGPFLVASMT